jgi:hypothetical protein
MQASTATDWRVSAARSLAWSVLLAGWVGVGSVVQACASGPRGALALMALWLLAISLGNRWLARWRPSAVWLRLLVMGVALSIAGTLLVPACVGAGFAAVRLVVCWAALAVLASAVVRACRNGRRASAASLAAAAAAGAGGAWVWLGDITDLPSLRWRLVVGAVAVCALLVVLLPRRAARVGGCHAALFDCALSAWPTDLAWQPGRWPLVLASVSMLPMMLGLPIMLSLCSSEAIGPRLALALHLGAMFAPACLLTRLRWLGAGAAAASALLLGLGVWAFAAWPGAAAWWGVAVAHGIAWSVAWAARLVDAPAPRAHGIEARRGVVLGAAAAGGRSVQ